MRRTLLAAVLLIIALPMWSKESIIPISAVANGANGTLFRTDVRLYNPDTTTDIIVQAEFLPVNTNNTSAVSKTITLPKGQMVVLNNIVGTFFNASGLGAIRFESSADFDVTSRTYTDSPNPAAPGTFGQFIPAIDESDALVAGAILHLSNSTNLSTGFRANAGFMNPGLSPVTVSVRLVTADGTQLGTGSVGPIPPRSVIQAGIGAIIGNNLNFGDGFLTFTAPTAVIGYASVVDNQSSDQIFIAAQPASAVTEPPVTPREVIVNVGPGLSFSPAEVTIREGDTVKWMFFGSGHTSTSDARTGLEVWDSGVKTSGSFSHTFQNEGDYPYYCDLHSVPGGTIMNGVVHVDNSSGPSGGGPGY